MAGIHSDGNSVLKDLTKIFEDTRAQQREPIYTKYTQVVDSDGAYEKYAFPTAVPFPRVFADERQPQSISTNVTQQLDNNTYELTLEFDGNLLEDARAFRGLQDMVAEAAASAASYPDYLVSQLVANGATSGYNAYDGNTFFGDTHLYAGAGSNNIDNALAGTGTSVTALATDFAAAVSALRTYKDDRGKLLNPNLREGTSDLCIVCHPSLLANFRTVLNGMMIPIAAPVTTSGTAAVSASNQLVGLADVVADGYLTETGSWYLFYTSTNFRPIILQKRSDLQTKVLGFDSEYFHNTNRVRICARQRMRAGYHAFYRAVKTTN